MCKQKHLNSAPSPGRFLALGVVLLAVGFSAAGCGAVGTLASAKQSLGQPVPSVSVRPPGGVLYSNFKAPLTVVHRKTEAVAKKTGNATTYSLGVPFFFGGALRVAWGDGGLDEAKRSGDIKDFKYAEYTETNFLSVFTKFTVHAHGD